MSRTPQSLTRLSAEAVNYNICSVKDFEQLLLPKTLMEECRNTFVEDKLNNLHKLPSFDCNNYPYDHAEPFISLDLDEYVNFQRINHVPWFAFHTNHIMFEWYEVNNNCERFCYYCIHVIAKLSSMKGHRIYKYKACEAVEGSELIHAIQNPDGWCSRCVTTTLFHISEYHFHPHLHFSTVATKKLVFSHLIE